MYLANNNVKYWQSRCSSLWRRQWPLEKGRGCTGGWLMIHTCGVLFLLSQSCIPLNSAFLGCIDIFLFIHSFSTFWHSGWTLFVRCEWPVCMLDKTFPTFCPAQWPTVLCVQLPWEMLRQQMGGRLSRNLHLVWCVYFSRTGIHLFTYVMCVIVSRWTHFPLKSHWISIQWEESKTEDV